AVSPAQADPERYELYQSYQQQWHGGAMAEGGYVDFVRFLYDSPVQTVEFAYRLDGRLVGVGICDVCSRSLSSVYFYFDAEDAGRSLGTFGGLWEIEWARRHAIPYYYLGYWIDGCSGMAYKRHYRPCEVLMPHGVWSPPPG